MFQVRPDSAAVGAARRAEVALDAFVNTYAVSAFWYWHGFETEILMKEKWKQTVIMLISMAVLIGVDQLVKLWTVQRLKGQPPIVLWQGVFELTYVENRGAAFGMLQNQQILFATLTVLVVIGLLVVCFRLGPDSKFRLTRICCTGVIAGAIGNFLDRMIRHYVVDMFYFKLIHFPVFNVADCYVVVFGLLFCVAALCQRQLLDDIGHAVRKGKS